jgi:hypothetical protein
VNSRPGILTQLEQDEVWVDADLNTHRLEDLTPRHRGAILRWLERRAEDLQTSDGLSLLSGPMPSGDAACDLFDAGMRELAEQDSAEWLAEQPLVQRLRALDDEDQAS